MNERMKFRIWDKEKEEMTYIDLFNIISMIEPVIDNKTSRLLYNATHNQERFVLMQSTGMKHNGKLIYEKDTFKASRYAFQVLEKNGHWLIHNTESYDLDFLFDHIKDNDLKFTGNIYEQYELLDLEDNKNGK